VKGPGRFVIFATGHHVEPWLSVYPDSDKVSGPGGILLRSSAVGYWHGEGTAGPSESVEIVREPEMSPPQPGVNALALDGEAKFGRLLGADRLDATVVEVDPGEGPSPITTCTGGRSGCWSWPERPPCGTHKARKIFQLLSLIASSRCSESRDGAGPRGHCCANVPARASARSARTV
jgi:hypothetical protein